MVRVSGTWQKYVCDGCGAHALGIGDTLPAGWRVIHTAPNERHACSDACEDVLAFDSTEPTPVWEPPKG